MERQIGFNPELGAALKTARTNAGLTQHKAAELANVPRNWLGSCEEGRSWQPNYDRLKRIARVYRIKPSYVLRLAHYDVGPSVDEEDVFSAMRDVTTFIRQLSSADSNRAREVAYSLRKELDAVLSA